MLAHRLNSVGLTAARVTLAELRTYSGLTALAPGLASYFLVVRLLDGLASSLLPVTRDTPQSIIASHCLDYLTPGMFSSSWEDSFATASDCSLIGASDFSQST